MSNTSGGSHCNSTANSNSGSTPSTNCNTNTSSKGGTCTATTPGTTWPVGNMTTPGCYVCNWNGSLLRVGESCFTPEGTMAFSFHGSDPLTVTFLCDDATTSIETCRTIATNSNTYCNF